MRKLLIIIALILMSGVSALAQGRLVQSEDSFLEKLQERDSVLIGDQLRYGFHLKSVPSGAGLMLPDFSKSFMKGDSVEIVRSWVSDTSAVHGSKKAPKAYDIDCSVIITSFEDGKYLLPPLSVIEETAKAMREGMLALIRPVITSTDGRWVATTRWIPAARAI